jgi:hypothetical protein
MAIGLCKREKCIYRDAEHLCDYCGITGHCKIATANYEPQDPSGKACLFYCDTKSCQKRVAQLPKPDPAKKSNQPTNEPERRKRAFSWDTERAEQLYHEGKSDGEIAKAVGTQKSAVFHWRTTHNLPKNENKRVAGWGTELGVKLYLDGMPARDVAKQLGVHRRAFELYLRNHGVRWGG